MSIAGIKTEISIPVYVEADLEATDDGVLNLVVLLFPEDGEATEARIEFEEMIDNIIEFQEDEVGYKPMYAMAHELRRMADRLYDTASRLEGSFLQYDLSYNDDQK